MAQYMAVEEFKSKMQGAMEQVKKVLRSAKVPHFAADVPHQYRDKYLLAECMTNVACASQLNCLEALGLTAEHVLQLAEWSRSRAVTFRFSAEQRCTFARAAIREAESFTSRVEEMSVAGASQAVFPCKVVDSTTEYFWTLKSSYEVVATRGVGHDAADRMVILQGGGHDEIRTTTKTSPHPEIHVPAATYEMNASWLFRQLVEGTTSPGFHIDRQSSSCRTPRRNLCVDAGFEHFVRFAKWAGEVEQYMLHLLQLTPDSGKRLDLDCIRSYSVFVPLVPLFAEVANRSAAPLADDLAAATGLESLQGTPTGTTVLSAADVNSLLEEERLALRERIQDVRATFPIGGAVGMSAEAVVALVMRHCQNVCAQWSEVLNFIESMLREQLISAIGKEVTPGEFAEYMQFHSRKLLAEPYAPTPFCFTVRRSHRHSPEGTLSIEEKTLGSRRGGSISTPIVTICSKTSHARLMRLALSASTKVSFGGDVYLHGYLSHQFSGQSGARLSLVCKARQFSSFLVFVGRIASAFEFEPKYGFVVQNKDELTIPLSVSTIPTPKEFKDAIESLSPEQQEFAQAFRAMQLESTLLGIVVIQIKPQLEKTLNLPPDSLTKEIKLAQDLMKLFVDYHIPSDLLSFDGSDPTTGTEIVDAGASEALEAVRGHLQAMHDMIEVEKKKEVEELRKIALGTGRKGPPLPGKGGKGSALPGGGPPFKAAPGKGGLCSAAQSHSRPLCKGGKGPPPPGGGPPFKAAPGKGGKGGLPLGKGPARTRPPGKGGNGGRVFCGKKGGSSKPTMIWSSVAAALGQMPEALTAQQPQEPAEALRAGEACNPGIRDYTQVPKEMDARFQKLDTEGAVRPTIIGPADVWTKRAQKSLLSAPFSRSLTSDDQKKETNTAFDLLDALTKSGALHVECASLHVIMSATHLFDKAVTEMVVQENVNPMEKVERSLLIMASTVHQKPISALIQDTQRHRLASISSNLLMDDSAL